MSTRFSRMNLAKRMTKKLKSETGSGYAFSTTVFEKLLLIVQGNQVIKFPKAFRLSQLKNHRNNAASILCLLVIFSAPCNYKDLSNPSKKSEYDRLVQYESPQSKSRLSKNNHGGRNKYIHCNH